MALTCSFLAASTLPVDNESQSSVAKSRIHSHRTTEAVADGAITNASQPALRVRRLKLQSGVTQVEVTKKCDIRGGEEQRTGVGEEWAPLEEWSLTLRPELLAV
jgi:hypothetical protein